MKIPTAQVALGSIGALGPQGRPDVNGAKSVNETQAPRDLKNAATGESSESEAAKKMREAEKVAADFETMFMDLIVKGMRKTAQPEESSNALDIYNGMLDDEYTKSMTAAQDFGVRNMLLDWMKTADPTLKNAGTEALRASTSGAALDAYRAQAGAISKR